MESDRGLEERGLKTMDEESAEEVFEIEVSTGSFDSDERDTFNERHEADTQHGGWDAERDEYDSFDERYEIDSEDDDSEGESRAASTLAQQGGCGCLVGLAILAFPLLYWMPDFSELIIALASRIP